MPDPGPERFEPSSAWRLLRQGVLARYFLGSFVSNLGNWFQDIAAAILIFELTGSATMVGGVAVASYGTSILLSPLGGRLADSFDRRALLVVTHAAQAVAAAILAILAALGLADAWVIFAFALVIGVGRAINNPALQALLPSLVRRSDLAPATALQAVTFNLARAVGPVLGALAVATLGVAAAFAVNALSFAIFLGVLLTIRLPPRAPRAPGGARSIRDGLRYVAGRPRLVLLLAVATVVGMATDPVMTLGPAFAAEFGEDPSWAGWLVGSFGAGAVLAAPFAGTLRRKIGRVRTACAALAVSASGLVGVALAPASELALAAAVLAGAAFLVGSTDVIAALQELTHDEVRGRVMALWSMGFLGSRPLAALIDGSLADLWSPGAAVLVLAGILLTASILAAVGYSRTGGSAGFDPDSRA